MTLPRGKRQILRALGQTIVIPWLEWSRGGLLAAKWLGSSIETLKRQERHCAHHTNVHLYYISHNTCIGTVPSCYITCCLIILHHMLLNYSTSHAA